jgi:hypothetical protein
LQSDYECAMTKDGGMKGGKMKGGEMKGGEKM